MDSLDGTDWDIVIAGTGIDESLLALALSRLGKKILHMDKNAYYGGSAAALSLRDAEAWVGAVGSGAHVNSVFAYATIEHNRSPTSQPETNTSSKLSISRAYSLALSPSVIYARSTLLSSLVSAKVDTQLDFLAMGSWWLCNPSSSSSSSPADATLTKVPSGREDLFNDRGFDQKTKRALIRFLRFVHSYEEDDSWQESKDVPFSKFLKERFTLSDAAQQPIHTLAMSPISSVHVTTQLALERVARHLRSIGVFGQGFGAVVPKWGGLAEITQVGCRGCAVGGGIYVLGRGVESQTSAATDDAGTKSVQLKLSSGEVVRTDFVAYGAENVPASLSESIESTLPLSRSISLVSNSLERLFPPLSGGTPQAAGAVVCVSLSEQKEEDPPIYIIIHTSDTGECPAGQCVLYTSTALPVSEGQHLLKRAVAQFLDRVDKDITVLWSMTYEQRYSSKLASGPECLDAHTLVLPPPSRDMVFDDSTIERIKRAWKIIVGDEIEEDDFLRFAPGAEEDGDDEDDAADVL